MEKKKKGFILISFEYVPYLVTQDTRVPYVSLIYLTIYYTGPLILGVYIYRLCINPFIIIVNFWMFILVYFIDKKWIH